MDIAIPLSSHRARWIRWSALGLGIAVLMLALSRLKPAAPRVERSSLLMDTVRRGAMVLKVRGNGTLVPVDVRVITTQVPCKVKRILLSPGTPVTKDSIIAELSSPELRQSADDAMWQMRQAQADYDVDRLNQKVSLESALAHSKEADAVLSATERLQQEGLQSTLEVLKIKVKAEEARGHLAAEEARMKLYENTSGHSAPARARLEQAKALYVLKQEQLASLTVMAGMAGVLQQVPLQVGQQLEAGASLAKVAKPSPLKAELRVDETQAKDILLGQPVAIDTRNGIVKGSVIRIDPAVVKGTVTVDASMDGEIPKGVRPDLSVEGTVEWYRADRVLFTGRPVQAQPYRTLSLFKLSPDGTQATRVNVKLGRASFSSVEILGGLKEGDRVILSDMSEYDGVNRIRLE